MHDGEVDPNAHYVEDGAVHPYKEWDYAVDVTPKEGYYTITIGLLPPGTSVVWPDQLPEVVNDGRVICDINLPGDYRFTFSHPQYPHKTEVVHVAAHN